jgi:hypothetical protein
MKDRVYVRAQTKGSTNSTEGVRHAHAHAHGGTDQRILRNGCRPGGDSTRKERRGDRASIPGRARHRVLRWVLLVALLLSATSVSAQRWGRGGGEGRYSQPIRHGLPEVRTGFMFCRLQYDSRYRFPSGYGWSTDYPRSDRNFMTRMTQLTTSHITRWNDGELGHAVVRATDPEIYSCPFLFASDPGTMGLRGDEVEALRTYLIKGGFLWLDDFWGEDAWALLEEQMHRVFPEYPIQDLPLDHPLYSIHYIVPAIPQIPSIQSWYDTGGRTQERNFEPGDPHMRAIIDDDGRILVLMTHNTDIADGWEREQDNEDFFYRFTAQAYGVGINVAIWVMSH